MSFFNACDYITQNVLLTITIKSIPRKQEIFITWEGKVHRSWTNLPVKRLSLNRSQWGGCSTKYDTPTETQVVYKWFHMSTMNGEGISMIRKCIIQHSLKIIEGGLLTAVNKIDDLHISLPPKEETLKISLHFWAGFWLRGVQS